MKNKRYVNGNDKSKKYALCNSQLADVVIKFAINGYFNFLTNSTFQKSVSKKNIYINFNLISNLSVKHFDLFYY